MSFNFLSDQIVWPFFFLIKIQKWGFSGSVCCWRWSLFPPLSGVSNKSTDINNCRVLQSVSKIMSDCVTIQQPYKGWCSKIVVGMFSWCAFLFTATSVYSLCQYLPLLLGFLNFFSELIYLFRNYNVFAFLHLTLRHHRSKHCLVVTFFWDVPVLSWDLLVIPRILLWHQSSKKKKPFDYWNIQIFIFCNVIWFSVSGFRYSFVDIATCHHKLQM